LLAAHHHHHTQNRQHQDLTHIIIYCFILFFRLRKIFKYGTQT
jgi:hypothetical protein